MSGSVNAQGDITARDIITGIQQHFTLIFSQPFHPQADLAQLRADYLACLRDQYRYLDMKGILQVQQVTQQLTLAAVYVPLKATTPQATSGEWLSRVAGRWHRWAAADFGEAGHPIARSSEPMLIEQALKTDPAVVVLGDPGAGKSTLLKILALALAEQPDGPLPILLPLNAYAHRLQQGQINLADFFGEYYAGRQQKLQPLGQLFHYALRQQQAVILLDGLDEVQAGRQFLVRLVQDFAAEHIPSPDQAGPTETTAPSTNPPTVIPGNRLIVTSRIVGYKDAPLAGRQWRTYTLDDFNRDDIERFVGQWTLAFARSVQGDTEPARQAAERERTELLQAIFSRPSVERLASNPLLLTILAMIKYTGVTLPEQRVKLYELYLEALIESWNLARSLDQKPVGPGINYEETVQVLAPLALWLRQENPTAGLVSRAQLENWLTGYYHGEEWGLPKGEARRRGREFLDSVERYSNLLLERGEGQYGFLHLTLEEMLAAKGLVQLYFDNSSAALSLITTTLTDSGWHETLQLAVGVVGVVQQLPKQAGALLQQIAALSPPDTPPGYAPVFAGQILRDVGLIGVSRPASQQVITALVDAMQSPAGPIRLRRDAGAHLGRLNWTPAPGPDDLLLAPVGTEPTGLDAFCFAPAAGLWLGKYPVTNRQFARFIEAGGYDTPDFWSSDGWAYRHGVNPTLERLTDKDLRQRYEDWLANRPASKRNRPYYWENDPWNNPLFPVVGISWYEAEAYARWLNTAIDPTSPAHLAARQKISSHIETPALKIEIRLPREQEWQAALAGRGDFPWGDAFDLNNLNCAEAWFGREFKDDDELRNWWGSETESWREASTTAVATFPQGASAAGIWDGSGNVWEWQEDIYDPDEQTRALRGGSWYDSRRGARLSSRYRDPPDLFFNDIGLRLVVAPILP
jgi:formylglycine-generating enzyme required for sulfatase activity/energy-coupling factor transporter ATP-binding protein EcfA2